MYVRSLWRRLRQISVSKEANEHTRVSIQDQMEAELKE